TSPIGAAMLERRTIVLPDIRGELDARWQAWQTGAQRGRTRSYVIVPLLHEGEAVGAITAYRYRPEAVAESQIRLLGTFARQAVIARANTQLFHELQASNRDLAEALERQPATADVLKLISRSPVDVQPALDAMVEIAARVCHADIANIWRVDGDQLRVV